MVAVMHHDRGRLDEAIARIVAADERRRQAKRQQDLEQPSRPIADAGVERTWQCESCHDLHVVDEGDGHVIPCPDCGAEPHRRRLQEICGLSAEQQGWTFASYRPQNAASREALKGVEQAVAKPRGFVSLWGQWGTGKTHLQAAAVNAGRARGQVSIYRPLAVLLDELRATFNDDAESFAARFDHFVRCRILALDEFDKWSVTPWSEEQVFKLMDARYARLGEGLTLIATNRRISREEPLITGTRWPGYLESRLLDGRCRVYEVSGGDVRPRMRWAEPVERDEE
ncbi:MAG: ATP-binding protein [Anaerolineae bacterium]